MNDPMVNAVEHVSDIYENVRRLTEFVPGDLVWKVVSGEEVDTSHPLIVKKISVGDLRVSVLDPTTKTREGYNPYGLVTRDEAIERKVMSNSDANEAYDLYREDRKKILLSLLDSRGV